MRKVRRVGIVRGARKVRRVLKVTRRSQENRENNKKKNMATTRGLSLEFSNDCTLYASPVEDGAGSLYGGLGWDGESKGSRWEDGEGEGLRWGDRDGGESDRGGRGEDGLGRR